MSTGTQIRVGGTWLATVAGHGELKWSSSADRGCEEASWRMDLADTFTHPSLRAGKLVEIKTGSANAWQGILSQPDLSEEGWTFSATGLADEFFTAYLCLDSGGNTTSIPNTAIDQAIADGFPGTRPASLSASAFAATTQTDALNYVGELLDAWSDSVSKRWRVDENAQVIAAADPTTPTWHMTPGSARIGLADDDYASDLYLRYKTSPGSFDTIHVNDPTATAQRRRAQAVDATTLGVTTSANVTNVGNGLLAKGKARFAWTSPANPSRLQLTTPGGQPADLTQVKGGQLVRTFGVINEQGLPLPYYDWVIGHAEYEDGSDTIQIAPVQLAARTLSDVLNLAVS